MAKINCASAHISLSTKAMPFTFPTVFLKAVISTRNFITSPGKTCLLNLAFLCRQNKRIVPSFPEAPLSWRQLFAPWIPRLELPALPVYLESDHEKQFIGAYAFNAHSQFVFFMYFHFIYQ